MKYREIKDRVPTFLNDKSIKKMSQLNTIDLEFSKEVLLFFYEQLADLSDLEYAVKNPENLLHVFLHSFPKSFLCLAKESMEIYQVLLIHYEYLYKKEQLNQEEYELVLRHLQMNMTEFCENMANEALWSSKKKIFLSEVTKDISLQVMETFKQLTVEDVAEKIKESPNEKKQGDSCMENRKVSNIIRLDSIEKPIIKKTNIKKDIYEVELTFHSSEIPIWRKVLLPSQISYKTLHEIIQTAFNWKNEHLYSFDTPIGEITEIEMTDIRDVFDTTILRPENTMIDEALKLKKPMMYSYDFNANWQIGIKLCRILSSDLSKFKQLPLCIEGCGAAPLENINGLNQYYDFIDIINDPNDPEYRKWSEWSGLDAFDPENVNLQTINELFSRFYQNKREKLDKLK